MGGNADGTSSLPVVLFFSSLRAYGAPRYSELSLGLVPLLVVIPCLHSTALSVHIASGGKSTFVDSALLSLLPRYVTFRAFLLLITPNRTGSDQNNDHIPPH